MKNLDKKITAFTLAELMVIFVVMGIIASVTVGTIMTKLNLAKKYTYYATFQNLRMGVADILGDGFDVNGDGVKDKCLPHYWSKATTIPGTTYPKTDPNSFLCNRLAQTFNTVGAAVACDTEILQSQANSSFTTSNGLSYGGYSLTTYNSNFDSNTSVDCETSITSDPSNNQNLGFYVKVDVDPRASKDDFQGFVIFQDGRVIPAPTMASVMPVGSPVAGDNTDYLSTSVRYIDSNGKNQWIKKDIGYEQALCISGNWPDTDLYCSRTSTNPYKPVYTKDSRCTTDQPCEVIINKP